MSQNDERDAPPPGAPPGRKAPSSTPSAAAFAGFGVQFVVALLLFLFLGRWLDRRLDTGSLFQVVGVFVGAGGSFYSMYRSLMAQQRRARDAKARGRE